MANTVGWLALKEIARNRAFTLSFVLSLSLGLVGFLALDTFKHAMERYLEQRSQVLLGGDLQLSSNAILTSTDEKALAALTPAGSKLRREIQLISMVATERGDSRLVDIRAVDDHFPFYGDLTLDPPRQGSSIRSQTAWAYPELLQQLGVKVGDSLKIGTQRFVLTHSVAQDPTLSGLGFRIAPRAYINIDDLRNTGLLATGSRVRYVWVMALPVGTDLTQIAQRLREAVSLDVKVETHYETSRDSGRFLMYLNDYLGLAALVATFFAGITCAYLFRSYLAKRRRDMAVLLSMGLGLQKTRLVYIVQLLIMGAVASVLSVAIAQLLLPLLPLVLVGLVPEDLLGSGVQLLPSGRSLVVAVIWALGGSVLVALPTLVRLGGVKPAQLFQDAAFQDAGQKWSWLSQGAWWLPALGLFWVAAVIQANSPRVGTFFIVGFFAASAVLAFLGQAALTLLAKLPRPNSLAVELSILSMTRYRAATLLCFVSLALGTLLLSLIPQLRTGISQELVQPDQNKLPALFLFDIQPDQLLPLKAIVQQQHAVLGQVSPLIRARLDAINGKPPVERNGPSASGESFSSREREEAERARSRLYNLSYRDGLSPSEEITAGEAFPAQLAPDRPLISVEEQFAKRVGVKLGDKLAFDVQGVTIEGTVVNFRRVKWTSFQPNFFVQFQPGVLDDAPQTLIASVQSVSDKGALQSAIVKELPNVSVIDVGATIQRVLNLITQMSHALNLMAVLAVVSGLGVIFAMAQERAQQKQRDIVLLKAIGLSFQTLRRSILLEFGWLGLGAGALGSALSIGLSWMTARLIFDQIWSWDPWIVLGTLLVLPAITGVTGLLATIKPLRLPAAAALGD